VGILIFPREISYMSNSITVFPFLIFVIIKIMFAVNKVTGDSDTNITNLSVVQRPARKARDTYT
jgi:hypothetical protein